MSIERKTGTEKITGLSKKIDIGTGLAGLVLIGGSVGVSIALFSGITYLIADEIERRKNFK